MFLSEGVHVGSLIQLSGNGDHRKGLEKEQKMFEEKFANRNKDATSKLSLVIKRFFER